MSPSSWQFTRGSPSLRQSIAEDPNYFKSYLNLAEHLLENRDSEREALELFLVVQRRDPREIEGFESLRKKLTSLGQ